MNTLNTLNKYLFPPIKIKTRKNYNNSNNMEEIMAIQEGENGTPETPTRTSSSVNSIESIYRNSPVRNVVRSVSPGGVKQLAQQTTTTHKNKMRIVPSVNSQLFKPESGTIDKYMMPSRISVNSERIKGMNKKPGQRRLTIGGRGRGRGRGRTVNNTHKSGFHYYSARKNVQVINDKKKMVEKIVDITNNKGTKTVIIHDGNNTTRKSTMNINKSEIDKIKKNIFIPELFTKCLQNCN